MAGWEAHINRYQFGTEVRPGDKTYIHPDFVFRDTQALELAGERVELHHAKGETEDAAWVWLPERQAALVGDLVVSSIPNVGNPNKPQRYTLEWAEALETIAALKPRVLLPGHGPVYRGEICCELLHDTARVLRLIHDEVVHRLNAGEWPIDIVEADIELPPTLAKRKYLRPVYGCVPFIVRDVLRRYAGWWSGRPSELFPAKRSELAWDLIWLCGRHKLVAYTRALMLRAQYERAVFFAEMIYYSTPTSRLARLLYADALEHLANTQTSFIARRLLLSHVRHLHSG
jgi:alkyl sulfatase BDS1-like metallo-beta-lactamase superfamily hydrolase